MTEKELRDLDVWIAEHVMGWRLVNPETGCEASCYAEAASNDGWHWDGMDDWSWKWRPSQDADCAMKVLEKCAGKCMVTIECGRKWLGGNQFMVARLSAHGRSYVEDYCKCAPTLPLAICLFAKSLLHK